MKLKAYAVAVTFLLLFFLACGGGYNGNSTGGGGNTPSSNPQAFLSALPGTNIFARKTMTTRSFNWSLTPKAFAQTTTQVVLSQSFSGTCSSVVSPVDTSGPIYRLGEDQNPACPTGTAEEVGQTAAQNAQTGEMVIGDGTITDLVAWTSKGSAMLGVDIHLWVMRNGTLVDTQIACTLRGSNVQRCSSTATFAAKDGDLVVATYTMNRFDSIIGLNVLFVKS